MEVARDGLEIVLEALPSSYLALDPPEQCYDQTQSSILRA